MSKRLPVDRGRGFCMQNPVLSAPRFIARCLIKVALIEVGRAYPNLALIHKYTFFIHEPTFQTGFRHKIVEKQAGVSYDLVTIPQPEYQKKNNFEIFYKTN